MTDRKTRLLKMASASTPSLFHKLGARKRLSADVKQVILNVYAGLRKEYDKESISSIVLRTAKLTGCSKSTVWKFKKEGKSADIRPNPRRQALFPDAQHRRIKVDNFDLEAIRRKVHSFFYRNEQPTVLKVLTEVNDDPGLPNFKRTTFLRLLHDLGFEFKRRSRDSALIDREDIQLARREYLRAIHSFREKGRTIYYLDETWVNAGHVMDFAWHDTTVKCARQAKEQNLTAGLKAPSGKGKRLIITHAGNEQGFVNGAEEIFIGTKTGDYHEEMDGSHFENWFNRKLLPNINPNSVIVMDNASYHSVKLEQLPTMSMKKADIQNWLTEKHIKWGDDMIKRELLLLVAKVRKQYDKYRIDTIAENAGHIVVRLPPYHCELNPIELVWGHVKNRIGKANSSYKLKDVEGLAKDAIAVETPEMWKNSVRHVIEKVEPRFWELDRLQEIQVEQLCFTVNTGSSDSDDTDTLDDSLDTTSNTTFECALDDTLEHA